MRRPRGEHLLVLAFALARTAFCYYRAAHQSIVLDEAYTYNRFLSGSWADVYWVYKTNNHVLYSLLAKLSVNLFGLSELAIRLPSVIAGFFLIYGAFRVLEMTVSRPVRWIAILAISLHPLMLDFSVAARGYGLSIALLVWAMYFAMRAGRINENQTLAGVLAGLAVSANLAISPAAIGLIFAIVLLETGPIQERLKALAMVAAPFQAVVIALNFGALRTATLQDFSTGFGFADWRESLRDLVHYSIHAAHRSGIFGTYRAETVISFWLLPGILILCVAACFLPTHLLKDRPARALRLLPAVTLFVALAITVALHYLLGLNYPEDRLGLYFLLLFGLTWAIAADSVKNPWIRRAQAVIAVVLVAQFATQFDAHSFAIWKYDMESRAVALRLQEACQGQPDGSMSVGVTWMHQPAMEFYRVALGIRALRPVEWPKQTEFSGHDFYVFNDPDVQQMESHGIRVVFADRRAGIALGTR
jgi:hypothetical protein